MRTVSLLLVLVIGAGGCSSDDPTTEGTRAPLACDGEPVINTTAEGVEFVRTPDSCFDSLPDWPYAPEYVEIDGLRQAYVDEGSAEGPVVLLLHGQPSWSYLYRKMIPVLADAGYRVIAMDHLGMGRSDKPTDITSYSYLGHNDRLLRFIEALDLRDINMFVQDWGSLIGLRVAGLNTDRFARIAVGNGILPVFPEGVQPFPAVENPDEIEDIPAPFADIPAQQVPFYDGCELVIPGGADISYFGDWMAYAMKAESFRASEVLEAMTWFDLPSEEEAAYDAPFPSRTYMAGPRVFPSLVNEVPGTTAEAWAGLTSFERPFLTLWASNDPGLQGSCEAQQQLIDSIPGAEGLAHDRLPEASHFLQDDQGEEIARRLVDFFASESLLPLARGDRYCEILLFESTDAGLEAEVWGTQNLSYCPAASWEALDPSAIRTETGAVSVFMNGPRIWLVSSGSGSEVSPERMMFGDLETRFLATVELDMAGGIAPYVERAVQRTTTFTFASGEEIYELTSPGGTVYVMQSLAQFVDESLTLDDLRTLSSRLELPEGWAYQARTLDADLVLIADGEATVIQDDLSNTYQRR